MNRVLNRRTRTRVAAASAAPTLVTVPLYSLLAATGTVPWDVLPALLVALAVQVTITYTRLRPPAPPATRPGAGAS